MQINENVTASEKKTKSLEMPAGTALAYSVHELLVYTSDSQFSIALDPSTRGGFVFDISTDGDEEDGPSPSGVYIKK